MVYVVPDRHITSFLIYKNSYIFMTFGNPKLKNIDTKSTLLQYCDGLIS